MSEEPAMKKHKPSLVWMRALYEQEISRLKDQLVLLQTDYAQLSRDLSNDLDKHIYVVYFTRVSDDNDIHGSPEIISLHRTRLAALDRIRAWGVEFHEELEPLFFTFMANNWSGSSHPPPPTDFKKFLKQAPEAELMPFMNHVNLSLIAARLEMDGQFSLNIAQQKRDYCLGLPK